MVNGNRISTYGIYCIAIVGIRSFEILFSAYLYAYTQDQLRIVTDAGCYIFLELWDIFVILHVFSQFGSHAKTGTWIGIGRGKTLNLNPIWLNNGRPNHMRLKLKSILQYTYIYTYIMSNVCTKYMDYGYEVYDKVEAGLFLKLI